jgi:formylglycine-generating enzyme required for sulfatase activity
VRKKTALFVFALNMVFLGCGKSTREEVSIDIGNGLALILVLIPAGKFIMGSPEQEDGRFSFEGPQHEVTISKSFYMGKYEVTQAQYEIVMGKNPSEFSGDENLPVENVSWHEAMEFCRKLSLMTGRTVRLPTEAEWEYACRAGTTTRFYTGNSDSTLLDASWYNDNSEGKTHFVGRKTPNRFGLYDMHGNVEEWCLDWSWIHEWVKYPKGAVTDPQGLPSGSGCRVLRGGSYLSPSWACRSASRSGGEPSDSDISFVGFRVVIEAAQSPVITDFPREITGNDASHDKQKENDEK